MQADSKLFRVSGRSPMRRLTLSVLLALTPLAPQAQAQDNRPAQTVQRAYNIEAGTLEAALERFARAAGINLVFDPALLAGLSSQGLQGSYSVADALQRLLHQSGIEATPQPGGGYSLRKAASPAVAAGAPVLAKVDVIAKPALETATGPLTAPAARRSVTASKMDVPLLETPRSVSVIGRERLDETAAHSVAEALRYTAGVLPSPYGEDNKQDWFRVRGFEQANFGLYRDGTRVPSLDFYSWQIDPYALERVELLKGPASVLYGANPPGGLIHLLSKRPQEGQVREVRMELGSDNNRMLAADVGGALDEAGTLRWRALGLARNNETQTSHVEAERRMMSASLAWVPDNRTSINLFVDYQKDDSVPYLQFWLPRGTLNTNASPAIGTGTFVGEPGYDQLAREQLSVGYDVSHAFGEQWRLAQNYRWNHLDLDLRQLYSSSWANDLRPGMDPNYTQIVRGLTYRSGNASAHNLDTRLEKQLAFAGAQHTVQLGVDYQQLNIDDHSPASDPSFPQIPLLNPYAPQYGQPIGAFALQDKRTSNELLGGYLQLHSKWAERWVLQAGIRHDHAETENSNKSTGRDVRVSASETTGSAGLVYLMEGGWAPFVSYAEFFQPIIALNAYGQAYQPLSGQQYETGVKWQSSDARNNLMASIFELTQENVRTVDPTNPANRVQTGEIRSRGLELEGLWSIDRHWRVNGAYSWLDPRVTRTNVVSQQDKRPPMQPRNLASLWLTYQGSSLLGLPWQAGLGTRYVGATFGDAANSEALRVPSYSLLDVALQMNLTSQVTARLNVSNLADKTYVSGCDYFCYYGNRRQITLGAGYQF